MNHDEAERAMLEDLSIEASRRAQRAVKDIALLVDAPAMPSIMINASNGLLQSGMRIIAAMHYRDASRIDAHSPMSIALVHAYGRVMQHYPDHVAMNAQFLRELAVLQAEHVEGGAAP